jgi:hypothetical protein
VNKPMVSSHGQMESGLKEAPMQNLNFVSAKGDVEFFSTRSCCKTKEKGLKVIFREAVTFGSDIELGQDYSHWDR